MKLLKKLVYRKVINKKSLSIIWWRTAESCVSSFNAKEMFDCISRRTNWFLRQKKNSEIVMNILHELSEQGKTVIVVTHSEEIVAQERHVLYL